MSRDSRVMRVWPSPPEHHRYVQQTLPGGSYVSTGYFKDGTVDRQGRGRTVDNCVCVTSLFFDADLLTMYDAARRANGVVLEQLVKDRKARLYNEKPKVIDAFRALMLDHFLPIVEDVMGMPPTLVLDSGWGFHLHYALEPEVGAEKVMLRRIAASVIAEVNQRALDRGRTMEPRIEVDALLDSTMDVGARLARVPDSKNTKAPGNPRNVGIVQSCPTLVGHDHLLRLQEELKRDGALLMDIDSDEMVPRPARPTKVRRVECDFRTMTLTDGRSWQLISQALAPGERVKVVCPFGGSSVGSGFFSRESDGRVRYYSSPTDTTYWNTYVPQARSDLANLLRKPSKTGKGDPYNTVSNLTLMLREDGNFDLWRDEFRQVEMMNGNLVNDLTWLEVQQHMETVYQWYWRPGREVLFSALEHVARERTRNPVEEYLQTLTWDGVPRCERWLIDSCHLEDRMLFRAYAKRWMIGLVARVLKPGCKNDVSLVLSGPQGFGKSTVFSTLVDWPGFEHELFNDTPIQLGDKDSLLVLHSCLIYEDSEMASQGVRSQEARKAFLSSAVDRLRPPYGRKVRTYKRSSVVVGTTNESEALLRDQTGSRRYWVVQCPMNKFADVQWLKDNREQLFAEAVHLYHTGEQWWLTNNEEKRRQLENEQYLGVDWFSQCASALYQANGGGKDNRITVGQFAKAIDQNLSAQRKGYSLSMSLKRVGFVRTRERGIVFYYKNAPSIHSSDGLNAVRDMQNARPQHLYLQSEETAEP
jgi:hypothetical protein